MEVPQEFLSSLLEDMSLKDNRNLENISDARSGSPTDVSESGKIICTNELSQDRPGLCSKITKSMKDNLTVETVAEQISKNLNEPNKDLIYKIVKVIGIEHALKFYDETRHIEQSGGICCKDGSRRKKPGGVFFYLIRHDESIIDNNVKKIFAEESQEKNKQRKNQIKERRKKRTEELRARIIANGLLSLVKQKKEA